MQATSLCTFWITAQIRGWVGWGRGGGGGGKMRRQGCALRDTAQATVLAGGFQIEEAERVARTVVEASSDA